MLIVSCLSHAHLSLLVAIAGAAAYLSHDAIELVVEALLRKLDLARVERANTRDVVATMRMMASIGRDQENP